MRARGTGKERRAEEPLSEERPPKEETRCPFCGALYDEKMVVGKTRTVKRGTRTYYQVVLCSCGKIYRGTVV